MLPNVPGASQRAGCGRRSAPQVAFEESSPLKRVLVTGASGFIGSHVCEELGRRGFTVRALARKGSSLAFLPRDAELARGDVTDPASLEAALADVHGVVHCAGLTKALSLERYLTVNRDGTRNLLSACRRVSPPPQRIVCLGSLGAFGPSREGRPLRETDEPQPVSHYGLSKLEAQRAAESFSRDLSVTILAPPSVYGPRDRDIYVYFRLAKIGVVPSIGRGDRYLSVIYVRDLARAAVECLVREKAAGSTYFVEDGRVHTWRTFAGVIAAALGSKPVSIALPSFAARGISILSEGLSLVTRRPPLLGVQKMRELLQPSWTCSGERIRRELGFEPKYSLSEGVAETARWYTDSGWL